VEALPLPGPTTEYVQVFSGHGVIFFRRAVGTRRACVLGDFQGCLDYVVHVGQDQRSSLLPVFLDEHLHRGCTVFHRLLHRARGNLDTGVALYTQLIPPHVGEADRGKNVNPAHHPSDGWLPVDCFEYAARRRGSHHVVTHPFYLHFWAGEARVGSPNVERDSICHTLTSFPFYVIRFSGR
jgi:hypothetical protein